MCLCYAVAYQSNGGYCYQLALVNIEGLGCQGDDDDDEDDDDDDDDDDKMMSK